MYIFNEYLRGKQYILHTDYKSVEKLGHLHNKTLNRLQLALLKHNFIIQYIKGSNMPADYLSKLPASKETKNIDSIGAFNPFQTGLYELQMKDKTLPTLQKGIL
jgi:hypothetical protein